MPRNHFRDASLRGLPVQAGRLESFEATQLTPEEVRTQIIDVTASTGKAASICSIPGVWTPEAGTPIRDG